MLSSRHALLTCVVLILGSMMVIVKCARSKID